MQGGDGGVVGAIGYAVFVVVVGGGGLYFL